MLQTTLTPTTEADLELLFAWAHIPQIWRYMTTRRRKEDLSWYLHLSWWYQPSRIDGDRHDWMINCEGRRVGAAHVNANGFDPPEVGLYIADYHLWGQGIGKRALQSLIVQCHILGYQRLQAFIHAKNKASIKIFERLGFRKTRRRYHELNVYELDLRTAVRSENAVFEHEGGAERNYRQCPA